MWEAMPQKWDIKDLKKNWYLADSFLAMAHFQMVNFSPWIYVMQYQK